MPKTNRYGSDFIFDDGFSVRLPNDTTPAAAERIVNTLRARYGRIGDRPSEHLSDRPRKPRLDLRRLVASDHAKLRLAQMRRQAAVTDEELLLCLRAPERVRFSDRHGTWVWVRDRLAVAVKETPSVFVVTTILWSTESLFDANPRPEKVP